jgi:hypothetical protein
MKKVLLNRDGKAFFTARSFYIDQFLFNCDVPLISLMSIYAYQTVLQIINYVNGQTNKFCIRYFIWGSISISDGRPLRVGSRKDAQQVPTGGECPLLVACWQIRLTACKFFYRQIRLTARPLPMAQEGGLTLLVLEVVSKTYSKVKVTEIFKV